MSATTKNQYSKIAECFGNLRCSAEGNSGYGLVLLMVFIASAILLATSLSMTLSPSVTSYVNGAAVDPNVARQVALIGLDAAQDDILTQLGNGVTLTTSYSYANTVSIPTYPLSGASAAIGSYTVTATKVRGLTYLLKATATANNSTVTLSRLVQLSNSPSLYQNAYAVYSLRKLFNNYSSSAVNVRCVTTGLTQDIGFTASGNFDMAGLRTCLGDSQLPLDIDSNAKAAYGLRKLKSTYSGYAIKVRRSSDNTTQDIGFDANGNLDTASLSSFVGSASGYITTWYDQSGNSLDLTQGTNANQPRIVNAGVIDRKNNAPAVYFGGAQSLANNSVTGKISGSELRAFFIADIESGSDVWGHFATLFKTGDAQDYNTATSGELLAMGGTLTRAYTTFNSINVSTGAVMSTGTLFQATAYHDASNNLKIYYNGTQKQLVTGVTASLAPDSIAVGTGFSGDNTTYIKGYVAELIIFSSSVTAANQTKIEKNQGHYYNINAMRDGFVTKWYDQSGNGYNLNQATSANQPGIQWDFLTNRASIYFNGSSNYFTTASTLNITSAQATAFGIANLSVLTNQWARLLSGIPSGGTADTNSVPAGVFFQLYDSSAARLEGFRNSTDLGVASFTLNQPFQSTSKFDGANHTLRLNGVQQASGGPVASTGNFNINQLYVGSSPALATQDNWTGTIGEVVLYGNNPTLTQIQNIEQDQRSYYGL